VYKRPFHQIVESNRIELFFPESECSTAGANTVLTSCVQLEVKSCEVLVRFALMHLIATNTSVWLRTLINEIMFEYDHLLHYTDHATPVNSTPGQCH